jgi:hypothetical protein
MTTIKFSNPLHNGFLEWPSKVTFEAWQKLTKYVFVPNSTSELHQWNMYLGFLKDNVPGLRQTYILHKLFWALNTNFIHNLFHPKLIGGTVKDCLPWGKWQRQLQVPALKYFVNQFNRALCILTSPQQWTQGKEFEWDDNSLLHRALWQPDDNHWQMREMIYYSTAWLSCGQKKGGPQILSLRYWHSSGHIALTSRGVVVWSPLRKVCA